MNGLIEQYFKPTLTATHDIIIYNDIYLFVPFNNNNSNYYITFASWEALDNPDKSGMFQNGKQGNYFEFRYLYTKNKKADIFVTGY